MCNQGKHPLTFNMTPHASRGPRASPGTLRFMGAALLEHEPASRLGALRCRPANVGEWQNAPAYSQLSHSQQNTKRNYRSKRDRERTHPSTLLTSLYSRTSRGHTVPANGDVSATKRRAVRRTCRGRRRQALRSRRFGSSGRCQGRQPTALTRAPTAQAFPCPTYCTRGPSRRHYLVS